MIRDKSRSYYFGASDTKFIVGNWNTKTFCNWWLEKLGLNKNDFQNKYTLAGTNYEHRILDSLKITGLEKDNQVILDRLRVNLDGNTDKKIYEVKTFNKENGFDIKKHKEYVQQVQVQMFATKIYLAEIVAYGLKEEDYRNYFNEIDKDRLLEIEIEYDKEFIDNEYKPKLKYLTKCLKKGVFPNERAFQEEQVTN